MLCGRCCLFLYRVSARSFMHWLSITSPLSQLQVLPVWQPAQCFPPHGTLVCELTRAKSDYTGQALSLHLPKWCVHVYRAPDNLFVDSALMFWSLFYLAARIWLTFLHFDSLEVKQVDIFPVSLIVMIFTFGLADKNNFHVCETLPVELMRLFAFWVSGGEVLLCSMFGITRTDNPMCLSPSWLIPSSVSPSETPHLPGGKRVHILLPHTQVIVASQWNVTPQQTSIL